ncbi:hypothetical protein R5R35_006159 [Gryllus longicercus]|uniref:Protein phosphatase inhibitor 2 n=1 Tax=Gryllus longicercus TaxID=2509291 RepID=A0AAN9Z5K5_9ORTH
MSKEPPNRDNQGRKSILKSPSQTSKGAPSERRKSAHWDEENIQETLHPANKDYGLMKIDEPKTPFNWESGCDPESPSTSTAAPIAPGVDADKLKEKLQKEINLDEESLRRKKLFEQKRKAHYDEYRQLKAANALLKKDSELEEEDDGTKEEKPPERTGSKTEAKEKPPGPERKSSQTAPKRESKVLKKGSINPQ